jgi:hypothetical protein
VATAFRDVAQASDARRVGWSVQFTPPLPEPWPNPTSAFVFVYATALPMELEDGRPILTCLDGVRVSHPFAVVSLRKCELARVVVLANTLEAAGIQGIRPANRVEIELMHRSDEVRAELGRFPESLSTLAQDYYRAWVNVNGVIARCLPASQQRFFVDIGSCLAQGCR